MLIFSNVFRFRCLFAGFFLFSLGFFFFLVFLFFKCFLFFFYLGGGGFFLEGVLVVYLFVFLFVFGGERKGESFCFALGWYVFYILWFLYLYTVCWTSCFNSIKIKKKMYLLFLIFIIFCIHLNNNLQHCTNMYNNTINILKKIYCN